MFRYLSKPNCNTTRRLYQSTNKINLSKFSTTQVKFNSEPSSMSEGETLLYNKLKEAFQPHYIKVTDVSGGCGSMYSVELKSEQFKGKRMVAQHRLINQVLKEDIANMHGLQLKTSE